MDYELLKLAVDVVQFLLTGAIGVYVYLANKNRVTNERIGRLEEDVDARLDDHTSRLATVEAHLEHLPGADAVGEVREMVARVGGDVKGVKAEVQGIREVLAPMQRVIDNVQQYLLNQNK